MANLITSNTDYANWVASLKQYSHQLRGKLESSLLTTLLLQIRQQLADDSALQTCPQPADDFPYAIGFSGRNLRYAKMFYPFYGNKNLHQTGADSENMLQWTVKKQKSPQAYPTYLLNHYCKQ